MSQYLPKNTRENSFKYPDISLKTHFCRLKQEVGSGLKVVSHITLCCFDTSPTFPFNKKVGW